MKILTAVKQKEAEELLVNIGNCIMERDGFESQVLAIEYLAELGFLLGDMTMQTNVGEALWPKKEGNNE